RRRVLEGDDMSAEVKAWIDEVVERTVAAYTQSEYSEEWDLEDLVRQMTALYDTEITLDELREDLGELSRAALVEEFQEDAGGEELGPPASPNGQGPNGNLTYEHQTSAGADVIAGAAAAEGIAAADAGASFATAAMAGGGSVTTQRTVGEHEKIGRNDPCWCG